jgi:hypothetical protein
VNQYRSQAKTKMEKRSEKGHLLILIIFAMIGLVGIAGLKMEATEAEKSQPARHQPRQTTGIPAFATGLIWFSDPLLSPNIPMLDSLGANASQLPGDPVPWPEGSTRFPSFAIPAEVQRVQPGLKRQQPTSRRVDNAEQLRAHLSSMRHGQSAFRWLLQLRSFVIPQKQPGNDFQEDGGHSLELDHSAPWAGFQVAGMSVQF